jgi:hypothetical protein
MRTAAAALALLCLAACLLTPVLFFSGALARGAFEGVFLAASVGWFVGAAFWASRMEGTAGEVLSS